MMPSAAVDMMPQSGLLHHQGAVGMNQLATTSSALSGKGMHEDNIRRLSMVDPTAAAMYANRAAMVANPGGSLAVQEMLERERLLGRTGM